MVAGNRLLDALTGGHISGLHAAEHASKTTFSGRAALETQLGVSEADLDFEMAGAEEGPVQRAGPLFAKLTEIMTTHVGMNRDAGGLNAALEALNSLESSAANLHVDDNSRLFNSNLLDALRIKAGIRLAKATVHSALSRTESRGVHQRADFTETDSEQMYHTLVDIEGNISTLAIRKGSAGSWVLTPEE
jgi:succinate dehydrogenase/fumarate reductase flavoprotein subunit